MTYDAIVVGGGIVGLSIAYHLVCARARTLLLDRGDAHRATDAEPADDQVRHVPRGEPERRRNRVLVFDLPEQQ